MVNVRPVLFLLVALADKAPTQPVDCHILLDDL